MIHMLLPKFKKGTKMPFICVSKLLNLPIFLIIINFL